MTTDRPRLGQSLVPASRPAFVTVGDDTGVPTNIDDYCEWLNRKEKRQGHWFVKEHCDPETGETIKRQVDWFAGDATDPEKRKPYERPPYRSGRTDPPLPSEL